MGIKLNLNEVPETVIPSGRWQPLNQRLGITHFGINGVAMDPGDDFDIEHDEAGGGEQEAYVVVTGRARFRVGNEEFDAGPGDVVAVPDPTETRNYWAVERGTRIICLGAASGAEHAYGRWISEEAEHSG
jgi:uncharacterized cupin superfamily protein